MKYLILALALILGITLAKAQFSIVSTSFTITAIPIVAVASLPACSATNSGVIYRVSDALAPTVVMELIL